MMAAGSNALTQRSRVEPEDVSIAMLLPPFAGSTRIALPVDQRFTQRLHGNRDVVQLDRERPRAAVDRFVFPLQFRSADVPADRGYRRCQPAGKPIGRLAANR